MIWTRFTLVTSIELPLFIHGVEYRKRVSTNDARVDFIKMKLWAIVGIPNVEMVEMEYYGGITLTCCP